MELRAYARAKATLDSCQDESKLPASSLFDLVRKNDEERVLRIMAEKKAQAEERKAARG